MTPAPRRPFGIQLLATVLTLYAMAGVLLAASMASDRPPALRWMPVAAAAAVFAFGAGSAALRVWRLDRRAPAWVLGCGLLGLGLCVVLPASAPAGVPGARGEMWRTALVGGALFLAFLALSAAYVRRELGRAR